MKQINSVDEVYQLIDRLKSEAQKNDEVELLKQLNDALNLGSSGLEILGGLRQVLLNYHNLAEKLLGSSGKSTIAQVVKFIDKSFGR